VLGIAVLIAVLDGASPADPVGAFRNAYEVITVAALVAAGLGFALGRVRAGVPTAVPEAA